MKGCVDHMASAALHHAAICTSDVDRSLRFWVDGMGLKQVFDLTFAGGWRELFHADTDDLRSIFLGDPERPDAGLVELVAFDGAAPGVPSPTSPTHGFFLLSFERDVDAQLGTLAHLGFADEVRRIAQPVGDGTHVDMAVITAPDGVIVELIGAPR
jgi:glyoxylase I family protein